MRPSRGFPSHGRNFFLKSNVIFLVLGHIQLGPIWNLDACAMHRMDIRCNSERRLILLFQQRPQLQKIWRPACKRIFSIAEKKNIVHDPMFHNFFSEQHEQPKPLYFTLHRKYCETVRWVGWVGRWRGEVRSCGYECTRDSGGSTQVCQLSITG